ncbi:Fic family protein [Nocardia carnea]|uniref:HTH iclR-type domain-containing protein n=1 Tax=Nocardia carnea TaxID=37328 RepID=A0ABW7TK26_9NOCA|nr:hypothetical protein [Nocardia carnea]
MDLPQIGPGAQQAAEARTDIYLAGLTSYREPKPHIDEWIIGFAQAAEQAAQTGVKLARDASALDEQLLQRLVEHRRRQGTSPDLPRRGAVALKILADLSIHPVITTESAAARYGVSAVAAHRALTGLFDAGVLGRSKNHKGKIVCYTADAHLGRLRIDSPE